MNGTVSGSEESEVTDESVKRGYEIAAEADSRASGFVDSQQSLVMMLYDRNNRSRVRRLHLKILERPHEGDWSMMVFNEPADVAGTTLLTYNHSLRDDEQWISLPALSRVKRVSSRNRSGPFMGSEFAFEDLASFELEKYQYRYMREEACGALQCFVSQHTPVYSHSGYARLLVWHDKLEYRIQRVDFFDKKNRHFKTLELTDYQRIDERFWHARLSTMTNHKTGKRTTMEYREIRYRTGLRETDFSRSALKRAY